MVAVKILIETTVLWGLLFSDSIYHDAALRVVEDVDVVVPAACFQEIVYPAYRLFSDGGKKPEVGISKVLKLGEAMLLLSSSPQLFGMRRLEVVETTPERVAGALAIASKHAKIFLKRDEKTGTAWLRMVDAITAYTWMELKLPLHAHDQAMKKFGKIYGLEYVEFP